MISSSRFTLFTAPHSKSIPFSKSPLRPSTLSATSPLASHDSVKCTRDILRSAVSRCTSAKRPRPNVSCSPTASSAKVFPLPSTTAILHLFNDCSSNVIVVSVNVSSGRNHLNRKATSSRPQTPQTKSEKLIPLRFGTNNSKHPLQLEERCLKYTGVRFRLFPQY